MYDLKLVIWSGSDHLIGVCVWGGGVQDIQDWENSIVHFALYAIKRTYIYIGMLKIDPRKGV